MPVRRQSAFYSSITNSLVEGVYAIDLAGRATLVNPAAERMLGRSEADLLGKEMHALVHHLRADGSPYPRAECSLLKVLRTGRPDRGEDHLVRRDGSIFPVAFSGGPISSGGRLSGAAFAFRDLTEQRLAEATLVAAQAHDARITALEQAKTQFLNLASHELRGPLGVVRGYVSMIEDGTLGALSPRLEPVMPIIARKLAQMDLMVNRMLDAARLEDSRLQLQLELIDLRVLVKDSVAVISPFSAGKHRLRVELPDQPVLVNVDPMRVGAIIQNLLDNAIKYSPDGGEVICVLEAAGIEVTLTVHDPGLGIQAGDRGQLFTRFGRIGVREHAQIPGTGLGLYLARELARLHGGEVTYRPRQPRGSSFEVRLPRAGSRSSSRSRPPPRPRQALDPTG